MKTTPPLVGLTINLVDMLAHIAEQQDIIILIS
jgi:hypothetical protein